MPLQWRHNDRHCVWNHQQFDGLLNYLFKLPSKKHQSPRYQSSLRGIHRWPVDFPHEGPANMESVSVAWRHNGIDVILIVKHSAIIMMTSSNGNIFRVTGHLCGEFTGLRWIPRTKASDAELWCFLWSVPDKRLSKPSRGWWSETQSSSLWRHSNFVAHMVNVNHHQNIPTRLLHNQWPFH